jgi:hypothetical protein
LPSLSVDQIDWWDETHVDQEDGKCGNIQCIYVFPRDGEGNLCVDETGTNQDTKDVARTSYKFTKQGRFILVVDCKRDKETGVASGIRCNALDYSGRLVLTIEKYEERIKEENNRVKALKGNGSGWGII